MKRIFPLHLLPKTTRSFFIFLIMSPALFCTTGFPQSAPLALDESFTAGVSGGTDKVKAISLQPDGGVLVGGDFRMANGALHQSLARFNSSGALDQQFNPLLSAGAVVDSILVQPDGKIIISGSLTAVVDGRAVRDLARLNPDGSFDKEFAANLAGRYSASELALQPDGKIVGAGYSYANDRVSPVFRLNPNGTPDAAFNPPLEYVNNLRSITIERDGKLLVGGTIKIGGQDRGGLVRLNSDGSLDTSFNPGGAGTAGNILQTIESANGQIYAAGEIDSYNGVARRGIVRLNSDGTLDPAFNANDIYCPNPASFVVQADGKLIIADSALSAAGSKLIVRLNSNGSLDQSFVSGFQTGGGTRVNRLLVQPDGRILVGGIFGFYGGAARQNLLRLNAHQARATRYDFDGDGRADVSVFRPASGVWYFKNSTNGFSAAQFGMAADKLVPADYDGDGKTDIAVFRDGVWYLQRSASGFVAVQFGSAGDIPQPGDYDGDGRAELAVYRRANGTWYALNIANNQFTAAQFGTPEDKPVAADFDGDGKTDMAVYRPSTGTWYLLESRKGFAAVRFGNSTDIPTPADYDGDGKVDEAVYRPSNGTWYFLKSTNGFAAVQFGISTDIPVPADYDGDGKTDAAVFRGGVWYLLESRSGFTVMQFGLPTDTGISSAD